MARRIEYPDRGEPITAEWARALVDTVNGLLDGPEVSPPLEKVHGTIGIGQDYQLYEAITTDAISARVTTQWGSGPAKFLTGDIDGAESSMLGFGDFTAWNIFGAPITAGIRIWVAWTYDKWMIIGGDCSGNP